MMYVFFTYLYMCYFFSNLYMHVSLCTQSLFLFHTWCLYEFCLSVLKRQVMKVYLAMNSLLAKFFQEFIVGIDLFCNTTSGYEFSDLRLLMIICFVMVLSRIAKTFIYLYGFLVSLDHLRSSLCFLGEAL